MSTFLGPIHYTMYNKILLQEKLCAVLTEKLHDEQKKEKLHLLLKKECGTADAAPLENVIDMHNIHRWLQNRIDCAEKRFAFTVTQLSDAGIPAEELEQAAFAFGQQNAVDSDSDAEAAFKVLNASFLDGMPCDKINEVLEQSGRLVLWRKTRCVHRPYWEAAGGNIETYYKLRTSWIKGMLSFSAVCFETENGFCKLTYKLL